MARRCLPRRVLPSYRTTRVALPFKRKRGTGRAEDVHPAALDRGSRGLDRSWTVHSRSSIGALEDSSDLPRANWKDRHDVTRGRTIREMETLPRVAGSTHEEEGTERKERVGKEADKRPLWPRSSSKKPEERGWCAALAVNALVVSFRKTDAESLRSMPSMLRLVVRPKKKPMELDGERISFEDGAVVSMRRDKPGTYVTTQNMRFAGTTTLELGTEAEVWAAFELKRPDEDQEDTFTTIPFEWRLEKADNASSPEHKVRQDACGHSWEQEVEISILGYLHETPCFLSRKVKCRRRSRRHMRRKTVSASSLEAIAEDERVAMAKRTSESSLWEWGTSVLPDRFEQTCHAMTELAAGRVDGQGPQKMTWFNAGVRIGVGVGLGVCLGVGLGVGVLMKSYNQAASTIKRKTFW